MSQQNRCPECGAELPSGTLGGLCPKCLLAAGLESRAEAGPAAGSGSEAPTTPHSGTFVPPDAASLAAHFPQLEILELLGHGGMGAVYKARQPKLDRMVALKIIRPESAHDPAFAERFNREARMLARLSHPRIVAVYDFGSVDVSLRETGPHAEHKGYTSRPLYYFLMEYVEGTNLRQLLQTGELLPQQALAIVPQICEALQFAHDEGIVHRDIKPENILLDKRGRVKIADFGLAKLVASSPQEFTLTGTHQVMGTPRYMAPEQMEGSHAVDHRADIYSLGVVFYEMLTGEVPMGHFEPPSQKVEIDVRLDEVVMRTLARAPQRRYQHASDVKNEVESISQTSWRAPTPEIRREIPIDDAEIKAARQQVQFPVIGLLVMGIFALPLAGRAFLSRYGDQTLSENPQQLLFWLAYFLPPLATLVGAVKMLQLSSYRWAVAASLLVMLSPAVLDQRQVWWIWWLCVLIGIWSLVVLSRPEVKRGFASQAQRTPGNPARVDPKGGSAQELGSQPRVPKWIYILGILQLLLGLLTLTGVGVGLMFADVEPDEEWLASNQAFREWGKIYTAVDPWIYGGLACLLLASGIGLLLGRRWGRTLALTYAVVQLTWGIASWPIYVASMGSLAREVSAPFDADERVMISSAVIGMLFLCASEIIYPLVVLVLLNMARIRLALAKRDAPNANDSLPTKSPPDIAGLVLNPAWGLIITGIISWVTIPLAFWIPIIRDMSATQRTIFQISFGVIPLVVGTIVALAGFRMKRLEGYRLAMFAAVLPIAVLLFKLVGLSFGTLAIGPADLVGAPIGLWVLVVLSRSDVKAAFHRPRPQEQSGHVKTDLEFFGPRRDELAPYGDASSKTIFEDYLLMNPRLPVAARWITVYAIVVRPVLWILVMWLGFLGLMSSLGGDHVELALDHIVDVVGGLCALIFVVVAAVGGVKLRGLRHDGPRWIKIGLGLGIGFGLLMFIVHLTFVPWFVGPISAVARTNPELLIAEGFTQEEIATLVADKYPLLIPDAMSLLLVLLWLALDIAAFVWLWRNSHFLPLSDAKALPEPKPIEAAPAGPISEKQRGTLGRAWDEWWAERDRWFTRGVLCVLLVVHIGCLAMFLTLRGGGGYDSGRPSAWPHVGWPIPWFVYERGVEPNVAFRRTTNLLSWSILVAGIGMLAWYAFWRIQLVRDARNARFWQTIGSPTAVLIAWIVAGAAFAWLGVRDANRLYESMRAQMAPVESPQAAEAPGS